MNEQIKYRINKVTLNLTKVRQFFGNKFFDKNNVLPQATGTPRAYLLKINKILCVWQKIKLQPGELALSCNVATDRLVY
jgi:hypothetical protein